MHGVFYYKSFSKFTPEYGKVIEFFKNSQTKRKYIYKVIPFCKIGYEEYNFADYKEKN